MSKYFMGVDAGTHGVRVGIANDKGVSLVGPRPERPFFVERFKEEIPRYMIKFQGVQNRMQSIGG